MSHLRMRRANEFNCYLDALFLIDATNCGKANHVAIITAGIGDRSCQLYGRS